MKYPIFFDTIEALTLYDPLSEALGAFEKGLITYHYVDLVKNAGHSCPTIAGAYLMVREGLKALYGDAIPQRGAIRVTFKEAQNEGTTGVVANVFSLITGATDTWGFKGLGGVFVRTGLLSFHEDIPLYVRMMRLDTQQSVDIAYNPNKLSCDARLQPLMSKLLTKTLDEAEKELFRALWQEKVRKILENFDKVIQLN